MQAHKIWMLAAAAAVGLLSGVAQAEDTYIGRIKTLTGDAFVERAGSAAPAVLGQQLKASDSLRTGTASSLGILFDDDTRIAIGSNSELDLSEYVYQRTSASNRASLDLKRGSLAVVAGKIIEKQPESLKVKTPAAVIAVRGTEFAVNVDPQGY